jgi:pimeloyl-ACP methyl ester carboxylesterase
LHVIPKEDGSHLLEVWELRKRVTPGWTHLDVMHRAVVDLLRAGACAHQGHKAVYRYDLRAALMALTLPTLILTNAGEDLYQHSLAAQALRPGVFELAVLEGGTHDIVDEQPSEWVAAVTGFTSRY